MATVNALHDAGLVILLLRQKRLVIKAEVVGGVEYDILHVDGVNLGAVAIDQYGVPMLATEQRKRLKTAMDMRLV